jgi:hypothetical protein
MISQYFAGMFTTEIDEPDPEVLEKVMPKVTDPINEQLMRPYGVDEVKKALFSIGDLKAPGGDGLHAVFFKKYWDFLGTSLTKEVLDAINEKIIHDG